MAGGQVRAKDSIVQWGQDVWIQLVAIFVRGEIDFSSTFIFLLGMSHTVSGCGCPESVMRMKIHQISSIHWLPMYLSPLSKVSFIPFHKAV